MADDLTWTQTSAHWGSHLVGVQDGRVVEAKPFDDDPDAAPAIANVVDAHHHRSRIARPAIRRRWLESGPRPDPHRGEPGQEYVEVSWDEALDRLADELRRVRDSRGNESIFGGSYGWGSAGRFHHAQSQLHRFLNSIGGYTRSVNDYSRGASLVLLPHLIGDRGMNDLRSRPVSWHQISQHTDLVVSFGGLRRSNTWVVPGGHARHRVSDLARAAAHNTRFVSFASQRDDTFADLDARSIAVRPGTDVVVMLALIHELITRDLADRWFLGRYTVGAEQVDAYVLGHLDGVAKTPAWAESISGVPAAHISDLAVQMAAGRTVLNVVYALQRARHGEQAVFAGLTLAAYLGQIGLPGGGFTHGFGSMGDYGIGVAGSRLPTFDQRQNPVSSYIPCARISDLLLRPGQEFDYDGRRLTYPEIRLAIWAGGNPFHHHQDLRRLSSAVSRLDTLVVNESHWTATAKHADIVLPIATTLERDDVAAGAGDTRLRAMPRVAEPYGESREEFWIYAELSRRISGSDRSTVEPVFDFDEGLTSQEWLRRIYEEWRAAPGSPPAPDFETFWDHGGLDLPWQPYAEPAFADFRADPVAHPLATPSGRIELFSQTLAGFGLIHTAGHAVWITDDEPQDEDGPAYDLELLCNQPANRLHSQHDMGTASAATKVRGREPIRLNPADAAARGLRDGDLALVRSRQGSLLAGVVVTDALMEGVAQMHTGAWWDPSRPDIADCIHGNVNVLTADVGASLLTQACAGARVRVRVDPHRGEVPPVTAHAAPPLTPGSVGSKRPEVCVRVTDLRGVENFSRPRE